MIKQIEAGQLRPGMHIHRLGGPWMDHPFWRSSFKLERLDQVREIQASGIPDVWIDTSKGLDMVSGQRGEEAPIFVPPAPGDSAKPAQESAKQAPFSEELNRAARICARSKQAIVAMFQDARMGKTVEAGSARPLVEEIADSVVRNPHALISLARLKTANDYTYMHSVAVCGLMIALSRELGLDDAQTREAGFAGLLHDVGKMAVPNEILNKPGKLTDQEFGIVKRHPEQGHQILLDGSGASEVALDVCLHHHEKVDGSGYPHRLKDAEITRFAKMGAVCDVYDAITSDRPYKKGWDPAEAVRNMAEWSKGHFDETVFHAFVNCIGIYPVGSLVRLRSGRLGIVCEHSSKSLLTPKVRVFFSTRSGIRVPPETVDLGRPWIREAIVGREDPVRWNFPDLNELWRGADLPWTGGCS
jgi:HD-GYP domain-containing protein (c-di-GMP phosphodiesterase class II)